MLRYFQICLGTIFFFVIESGPASAQYSPIDLKAYHSSFKADYFPPYLKDGFAMFRLQRFGECVQLADKASSSPGRKVALEKAQLLKAICLQGQGQHQQAIEAFKDSLRMRASCSDCQFLLAVSRLLSNDFVSAVADLEDAVFYGRLQAIPAKDVELLLGYAYKPAGNAVKSEEYLNKVLSQNPKDFDALFLMAGLRLDSNQKFQAIEILRPLLVRDPENIYVRLQLVQSLLRNADRIVNKADIQEAKALAFTLMQDKSVPAAVLPLITVNYIVALLLNGDALAAQRAATNAANKYPTDTGIARLKQQADLEVSGGAVSLTPAPVN